MRIAQVLNTSFDHVVFDHLLRGPLHAAENILDYRLAGIAELSDEDANALRNFVDGLIAKGRLRILASDVS